MTSDRYIAPIGIAAALLAAGMSYAKAEECRPPKGPLYELTFCSPPLDRRIAGEAVPEVRRFAPYRAPRSSGRSSTWKFITTDANGKRKVISFPVPND